VRHRARDILLLPAAFCVGSIATVVGAYLAYVAICNWSPVELTCAELWQHPPTARWLRLSACEPGISETSTESMKDKYGARTIAVYVPLRPADAATTAQAAKTRVLLRADHGPLSMLEIPTALDDARRAEIATLFDAPIEVMVEAPITRGERNRDDFRDIYHTLDDHFIIVDFDDHPEPLWRALLLLAIGAAALTWMTRRMRARRAGRGDVPRATIIAG
jgi:hypothetical protein